MPPALAASSAGRCQVAQIWTGRQRACFAGRGLSFPLNTTLTAYRWLLFRTLRALLATTVLSWVLCAFRGSPAPSEPRRLAVLYRVSPCLSSVSLVFWCDC